jgi:hypothetical protein
MIPYIIKQARPAYYTDYDNVIVNFGSTSHIENLDKVIIDYIVDEMYSFCSEEYGHNINITSYSDFCEKYWEMLKIKLKYWDSVFEVYYFENKWIDWDITAYQDKILSAYMEKLI